MKWGKIFMRRYRALILAAAVPLALVGPAAYAAYTEIPTTTESVIDNSLAQYGQARTVTVTVKSKTGSGAPPTGQVQFSVPSAAAGHITPSNGLADLNPGSANSGTSTATLTFDNTTPAQQSYSISAQYVPASGSTYTGSTNATAATLTIFKRATTVTLTAANGGGSGSNRTANMTVKVSGFDGTTPMSISPSGGTIVWQYNTANVSSGWSANQTLNLTGSSGTMTVGGLQNSDTRWFRVVSWTPATGENNFKSYAGPSAAKSAQP